MLTLHIGLFQLIKIHPHRRNFLIVLRGFQPEIISVPRVLLIVLGG